VVEQAIEANRAYADGFDVQIRLDPGSGEEEVYADADRLVQIVTNLLSNAIKFSPRDAEVAVTITENAGTVRLAVRDHGPGIPREFRSRIFQKFAQADGTDARQEGGTGLGLSIVRQIVTKLGGSVGFEDAEGGGTIFWVMLPAWSQVAARDIDPDPGEHRARILFCGDSLDDAMALREGLRPSGFCTDFGHSTDDCVNRIQARRYDVILVDLDRRSESTDVIRTLRAEPEVYRTPILGLSSGGDGEPGAAETANFNVLECIRKPVDIAQLAQSLDAAIRREANGRPQILHVDDDCEMLEIVAHTLDSTATVISAASMEEARCALLVTASILSSSTSRSTGFQGSTSSRFAQPQRHSDSGHYIFCTRQRPERPCPGENQPEQEQRLAEGAAGGRARPFEVEIDTGPEDTA